jgi:hypothetical protein
MELSADSQPYPQFTQNTLERIQSLQLGPRAWGGGGSGRIPAAPAAGSDGNEVGEVCGLTSDQIVGEVQAEKRPAAVLGGARWTAAATLLL